MRAIQWSFINDDRVLLKNEINFVLLNCFFEVSVFYNFFRLRLSSHSISFINLKNIEKTNKDILFHYDMMFTMNKYDIN